MKLNLRLTALMLLIGSSSFAADYTAKEHFDRGTVFYNLQEWDSAIKEYKAAYELEQKPEYLFSIGQAQRQAGDCAAAIKSYRTFMRTGTASQSAASEALIHNCEQQLEKQKAEAEARAHPPPETAATPPATTGAAPPPAATVTTGPVHWYTDVFGDVLFVLGLGGVGAGLAFLIDGNSQLSSSATAPHYSDYRTSVSAAQPKQLGGVIALSAGGVLLAGSVIRWVVVGNRPDAPTAGLIITPAGAAVSLGGRF